VVTPLRKMSHRIRGVWMGREPAILKMWAVSADNANFLEAWRKRSHPEHQEMGQWVGKHFKPELFSVQQVNAGLALFISLSSKT
jgi:hypothetical protein